MANEESRSSKELEAADDSRLLKLVDAVAINPTEAKKIVEQYRMQSHKKYPSDSEWQHQERIADKIIARYAKMSAMVGGASALTGVVPGLGTAIAITGGATADAVACMKLQVDMTVCLGETFGYDVTSEDARHLAFLIAAGATLEKVGATEGARVASQASVHMLRQYLRGTALQAVKGLFRKVGITFTRKALGKALPFGIGVAVGSGANYALTRYVGLQAREWFIIDRSTPEEDASEQED